jgi:hypothetical protein
MTDFNKYDTSDLVMRAYNQKPLEFEAVFNDLIIDKLQTAINDKKIQIAQQMYNYNGEETSEDNSEEE